MYDFSKIRQHFTFNNIVGYFTIIGSIAIIYGANNIYSLTIKLKPVIKIIQEEQSINQKISPDTIVIMRRDTIIIKDTVFMPLLDSDKKNQKNIWEQESDFRGRHPEVFHGNK